MLLFFMHFYVNNQNRFMVVVIFTDKIVAIFFISVHFQDCCRRSVCLMGEPIACFESPECCPVAQFLVISSPLSARLQALPWCLCAVTIVDGIRLLFWFFSEGVFDAQGIVLFFPSGSFLFLSLIQARWLIRLFLTMIRPFWILICRFVLSCRDSLLRFLF